MTKVIINQGEKTLVKDFKFEIGNFYMTKIMKEFAGENTLVVTKGNFYRAKNKQTEKQHIFLCIRSWGNVDFEVIDIESCYTIYQNEFNETFTSLSEIKEVRFIG